MRKCKNTMVLLMVILLMLNGLSEVEAVEVSEDNVEESLSRAINYLRKIQNDDGGFPSKDGRDSNIAVTCWVIMALKAAGEEVEGYRWTRFGKNPVDYLLKTQNTLDDSTEYAKILLAMSAADAGVEYLGEDLRSSMVSFQREEGNLAQEDIGEEKMINAHMWSVMAVLASGGEIQDAEKALNWLKDAQNSDGGFAWVIGGESDTDDTAAAIQTLVLLGEDPKTSPVIEEALAFIKSKQQPDGGFSSSDMMGNESNSASDAWAIQGIIAAGEDPRSEEWSEYGKNPIDHLLSLQDGEGSFYWKEGVQSSPVQMTAYAVAAMSQKPYPVNINYDELQSAPVFSDLESGHWSYEAVAYLTAAGAINGYPDGSFKPENKVTRAEFTSMFVKAMDFDWSNPVSLKFHDVITGAWYYPFVSAAYVNGIIQGKSAAVFDPYGNITGAELATMLVNSLDDSHKSGIEKGEFWYSGNVALADELDFLADSFKATSDATRAECAYSIRQQLKFMGN